MIDIEVRNAAQAASIIEQYGCAIWRGLIPTVLIRDVLDKVIPKLEDKAAYASLSRGTMNIEMLGTDLIKRLMTPDVVGTFGLMLQSGFIISALESCVFIAADNFTPTVWHQDACVNRLKSAIVWVAMAECGVTAPGISFALRKPDGEVPVFLHDNFDSAETKNQLMAETGWPVITPVFQPGDAVFFNSYSIHKTHVTPDMSKVRAAFKLTAVPNGL